MVSDTSTEFEEGLTSRANLWLSQKVRDDSEVALIRLGQRKKLSRLSNNLLAAWLAAGAPAEAIGDPAAINIQGQLVPRVPVVGAVAAGTPILANENESERIEIPDWLVPQADFALDVQGDSMEPRISDGDRVIVRKTKAARNKEIVVAQIADPDTGETTASVKFLRDAGGVMVLRSANPAYEDVPITNRHEVIGVVMAVIRYPDPDWMPETRPVITDAVPELPGPGEPMGLAETFEVAKRTRERDER